jgi:hypothetical protein
MTKPEVGKKYIYSFTEKNAPSNADYHEYNNCVFKVLECDGENSNVFVRVYLKNGSKECANFAVPSDRIFPLLKSKLDKILDE